MEFKGTKEILIDQGSIFKPLSGYISVNLTNSEGWPVATVWAPDFEKLHADAILFQNAPEMLEALQQIIRLKDLIEYDESIVNESNIGEASAISQMINRIETLIKEATEI